MLVTCTHIAKSNCICMIRCVPVCVCVCGCGCVRSLVRVCVPIGQRIFYQRKRKQKINKEIEHFVPLEFLHQN